MKSPDEIKKGLECCSSIANCADGCPYHVTVEGSFGCEEMGCEDGLLPDALAIIQHLEAENAEQAERIQQLEAERDAAVAGLKKAANEEGECFECKWYNGKNCTHQDYKTICSSSDDKWEWRGVQKVDGNEKT